MYDLGVGNPPKNEAESLKELYPGMRVIGCEPNPMTYRTREREYPGILFPYAIRDFIGMTPLYLTSSNPDMCSVYPRSEDRVMVTCITLDMLDELCGVPERILLWMDIEGAELEALSSGPSLLQSGRVKWINLELRDDPLSPGEVAAKEIHLFLLSEGYEIREEYNHHGTHRDAIYTLKEGRRL